MTEKIRWIIVGTGHISEEFAKGIDVVESAVIAAVVSRSMEKGIYFAQKYRCPKVYTDFEEALKNETADIVYLGIPNSIHYSYAKTSLENNTAVLCEKPITDNQTQLFELVRMAKERRLFLMEGVWTRCFPAVKMARKWLNEGEIGSPLGVRASFDFRADPYWQSWKKKKKFAGGALRDVGIYTLSMADMVFEEEPSNIYSNFRTNGETDESFHLLLDYGEGRAALLSGAFDRMGSYEAEIIGEKGRMVIGPEFWHPTTVKIFYYSGTVRTFQEEYRATGFQYEIQDVQECLREGKIESPCYTFKEMSRIAGLIEEIRKSWGIYYETDSDIPLI